MTGGRDDACMDAMRYAMMTRGTSPRDGPSRDLAFLEGLSRLVTQLTEACERGWTFRQGVLLERLGRMVEERMREVADDDDDAWEEDE